ncbi:hypothetical protein NPIL_436881 [Nephila pilipes]|uniref:Uncharacterized protein n=1 Tax=Nephila pilipes TaxID=299642 RepID=A0A8X6JSB0_NEPPI|nr:hypothetical protein NPIL_436881 [Nephila pilipes]
MNILLSPFVVHDRLINPITECKLFGLPDMGFPQNRVYEERVNNEVKVNASIVRHISSPFLQKCCVKWWYAFHMLFIDKTRTLKQFKLLS